MVCFQKREDATGFPAALAERLVKFGLEVEPTKTKVLEFGRDAVRQARARGERPGTFDFLGFTHYCSRTKDGKRFRMKRVTSRKKYSAKLVNLKEWLKRMRIMPTRWILEQVGRKLRGHYAYYGVTDNHRGAGTVLPRSNEAVVQVVESAQPATELQVGRVQAVAAAFPAAATSRASTPILSKPE